jgi:hypothetical protein
MKRYGCLMALMILGVTAPVFAAGHFEMVWFRQWGRSENGQAGGCGPSANHVLQVWVFAENGVRMGNVHVLDQNGVDHGWYTAPNGERLEVPLTTAADWGVQCTDDAGATSDISPVVTVAYGACYPYYSYDVGFVYKADAGSLGDADSTLNGVVPTRTNGSDDNPYTKSMVYSHQDWTSYFTQPAWALGNSVAYHSQSFMTTNVNRILGVFLFPVQPANAPTQWKAEIREGGPNGPLVCERSFQFKMYFAQPLAFGRDQCIVTPNAMYTVKLVSLDPTICNTYLYPDTYPNGNYYETDVPDASKDMFGFVWGWDAGVGTHGVVSGTVTDSDDGQPLNNAEVTLTNETTSDVYGPEPTDADGEYQFLSVEAGTYTIDVTKAEYQSVHSTGNAIPADAITVKDFALDTVYSAADFDHNLSVDLTDYGFFLDCYTGPADPVSGPNCEPADFDGNNHVDLSDYGKFLDCYNGPGRPYAPTCGV